MSSIPETLPQLRFEIAEVARILRMSRATLYQRIRNGQLKIHKDGRRTYVAADELPMSPGSTKALSRSTEQLRSIWAGS